MISFNTLSFLPNVQKASTMLKGTLPSLKKVSTLFSKITTPVKNMNKCFSSINASTSINDNTQKEKKSKKQVMSKSLEGPTICRFPELYTYLINNSLRLTSLELALMKEIETNSAANMAGAPDQAQYFQWL